MKNIEDNNGSLSTYEQVLMEYDFRSTKEQVAELYDHKIQPVLEVFSEGNRPQLCSVEDLTTLVELSQLLATVRQDMGSLDESLNDLQDEFDEQCINHSYFQHLRRKTISEMPVRECVALAKGRKQNDAMFVKLTGILISRVNCLDSYDKCGSEAINIGHKMNAILGKNKDSVWDGEVRSDMFCPSNLMYHGSHDDGTFSLYNITPEVAVGREFRKMKFMIAENGA